MGGENDPLFMEVQYGGPQRSAPLNTLQLGAPATGGEEEVGEMCGCEARHLSFLLLTLLAGGGSLTFAHSQDTTPTVAEVQLAPEPYSTHVCC
jgi:hypothetical protein